MKAGMILTVIMEDSFKGTAPTLLKRSASAPHRPTCRDVNGDEFFSLASSSGVAAKFVRIVPSRCGLLANLLAFLVFAVLPAGEIAP
jgi:hypothetical protein